MRTAEVEEQVGMVEEQVDMAKAHQQEETFKLLLHFNLVNTVEEHIGIPMAQKITQIIDCTGRIAQADKLG